MQPTEKYVHHKLQVNVLSEVKGKHREHCLCFNDCAFFHPNKPEQNCIIANAVFQNCVKFGIVTPVYECPKYRAIVPVEVDLQANVVVEQPVDPAQVEAAADLDPADLIPEDEVTHVDPDDADAAIKAANANLVADDVDELSKVPPMGTVDTDPLKSDPNSNGPL